MKELQSKVAKFVNANNLAVKPEVRLLDVCSELGELAKEVLKNTDYGKKKFDKSKFSTEELGDVLFSIICFANALDSNLEADLDKVMDKYYKRLAENNSIDSGQ